MLWTERWASMDDRQKKTVRNSAAATVAVVALAGLGLLVGERDDAQDAPTTVTAGLPKVIPTTGGWMEISSVTVYENFERMSPPKKVMGVELPFLGQTRTLLQLKTVYRYGITLEKLWPVEQQGDRLIVRTAPVTPSLPVAFDTSELKVYSDRGWARLDERENLQEILKDITPLVNQRAKSEAYASLARNAGRQVVSQFVWTWLLKEQDASNRAVRKVVVLYPGEGPGDAH